MNEIFLIYALALPINRHSDYMLLKEFIEKRSPTEIVVFINEDETLLNPGARKTPISTVKPNLKTELRIWTIRKSA